MKIDFSKLEKIAEFRNGELQWLEGRDINAVYVILVGDEYYIGSSHYTYLRIGQHLGELEHGHHHSQKLQDKFNEVGAFDVYSLDRGIEKHRLQTVEFDYIEKYKPTLNIRVPKENKSKLKVTECCKRKGITLQELADKLGVARSTLANTLVKKNPTLDTLEKIAKALDVKVADLFEEEQDKNILTCPKCGARFKLEE